MDNGFRFVVIDPLMLRGPTGPVGLGREHVRRRPAMRHLLDSAMAASRRLRARTVGSRPKIAAAGARALAAPDVSPTPRSRSDRSQRSTQGEMPPPLSSRCPTRRRRSSRSTTTRAIGAIQAARARGLRVPDDLSVVGFDDVEHATVVTPALTTVHHTPGRWATRRA